MLCVIDLDRIHGVFLGQQMNNKLSLDNRNSRMIDLTILFIILIGFYLRVSNVFDQVPWDGEDFMAGRILESKTIVTDGAFPGVSKPLWQLFVALGYQIMGFRLFVGSLLSVMFGTAIIALVYKCCTILVNKNSGVVGAVLVSSMLTFIHFSRLPQAPMASLFCMLLGICLYLYIDRNRNVDLKWMILVGFVMGFTIVLHSIYFIPAFLTVIVWELINEYSYARKLQVRILRFIGRSFVLLASMLLPILIAEIIVRVCRSYGLSASSWLGGAYLQMFDPFPDPSSFSDFFSYIVVFVQTDGMFIAILFVLSLIFAIQQFVVTKSMIWLKIVAFFVIPFMLLELSIFTKGLALKKYYVIFMIGVPIMIGCCISIVFDRVRLFRRLNLSFQLAQWFLIVILLGSNYLRARPRIQWTSGVDTTFVAIQALEAENLYYATDLGDFYFDHQSNAYKLTEELSQSILPSNNNLVAITVEGSCDCFKNDDVCQSELITLQHFDEEMLKMLHAVQGYGPDLFGSLKPNWCHVLFLY